MRHAGAEGTLLVGFKNPKLKPLTGKTLAQVAKERGVSPQDAAIDLVIEDGSRVQVVYFLMDEANVARQTALPWMSFGSDAEGQAPEGAVPAVLHPPARLRQLRPPAGQVRARREAPDPAPRRSASSPPSRPTTWACASAGMLKAGLLRRRGGVRPGDDPGPRHLREAAAVRHRREQVVVNGQLALENGEPTAARPGRVVRGRGWTGWQDGGCRKSAKRLELVTSSSP